MLQVRMLGKFVIELNGQPVQLASRTSQSLFAFLLLNNDQSQPREKIAALLWPDSSESIARNNLRGVLWRIRKVLQDAGQTEWEYMQADNQAITLSLQPGDLLDITILDRPVTSQTPTQTLIEVASAYIGELLPGFYDDWVMLERERLQATFERRMAALLERLLHEGRWNDTLEWAEHWIAQGNTPEPAYRTLMLAHAALGDHSKASATYHRCLDALHRELGVEVSEQTRSVFEQILADQNNPVERYSESTFPFNDNSNAPRHNLPAHLTPFIGRELELDEITTQLKKFDTRLVTIFASGGMGKTRLALQASARLLPVFTDGVWFVSLAQINSAVFIVPSIVEALRLVLMKQVDPQEQLLLFLKEKELLLVLDNFEQLLPDGLSPLLAILHACPRVRMLVTSRQRLNLQAEWPVNLQGLSLPTGTTHADLRTSESVALFLQQAQRASGFAIPEYEYSSVVTICRLVHGMPLALVLAASWTCVLTCPEIAFEIERDLNFLASNLPDLPERQRSIRAVLEGSWQRLSETEQAIFQQLSIFRGGFERQASFKVAGASLPALIELLDKALLIRDANSHFQIHELLRQWGLEKLDACGITGETRQRHLTFYMELAEVAEPELEGKEQKRWLDRLEQEHDNLRTALEWALRSPRMEDLEAGMRLASASETFWRVRGHWQEAASWIKKLISNPKIDRSTPIYLKAHLTYLNFPEDLSISLEEAIREYLKISRALGDDRLIAKALLLLVDELSGTWILAHEKNAHNVEKEEIIRLLEEALLLFRTVGDTSGAAEALRLFAIIHQNTGDYQVAHRYFEDALALERKLGRPEGIARGMTALGQQYYHEGQLERSREILEEVLPMAQDLGDRNTTGTAQIFLGAIAFMTGRLDQADVYLESALILKREVGNFWGVIVARWNLALSRLYHNDLVAARSQMLQLLSDTYENGFEIGHCLIGLSGLALAEGRVEQAAVLIGAANQLIPQYELYKREPNFVLLQDEIRAKLKPLTFERYWGEGVSLATLGETAVLKLVEQYWWQLPDLTIVHDNNVG